MEKGDTFYYLKKTKCHYVGKIIDTETMVVYKKWNKFSWSWDYKCQTLEKFNLYFKLGFYTFKK